MEGDVDRGGGGSDAAVEVEWVPRCLAFRADLATDGESQRARGMRVVVQKPFVLRLTTDIVETYQICNPKFQHSEALNPRRFLMTPHTGVLNDGFDNANSDLILSVNFVLTNEGTKQRYIVKKMLGQGTFGQVVECLIPETDTYLAVKVIKNQPAYYHQALHEVSILKTLNQKYDPEDRYHIVRMLEYFVCQRHLCISFEKLGSNLFELLKMNQLKGLSLTLIRMFSKQMLQALVVLKDSGIIHCDLKPENILLCASVKPPRVKIIDFGSACKEGRTVYSYIQSRYYRSPEVVLGYPYTTAIDMWSFGCIIAELFLGLPLFPGSSEYDLLRRMILVLKGQPPDIVLRDAKNTSKYFKHVGSIHNLGSHGGHGSSCAYHFLTEDEYEAREQKRPIVGKWYFNGVKLSEIVDNYTVKKTLSEEELDKERIARSTLIDFLRGLLEFDPEKRWTPLQASGHPFITGNPFSGPYNPPSTSSHIPVSRHVTVDYGHGQGHWLAAGLSPQVLNTTRSFRHSSPHFTMAPFTHGGSFGSYNETGCHRGSYGSYGDGNHMYGYYSPGGRSGLCIPMHLGGSTLGNSPDARAMHHFPYGGGFGMSPTRTFGPMSLGVSPSQYTPPSMQIQVSNVSPGKYGPTSPARGTVHGSPLGKAAALGQYNKKRNLCPPGTAPVQLTESAPQRWHAHHLEDALSSYPEASSQGHFGSRTVSSSSQPGWTKQRGNNLSSSSSAITLQSFPPSHSGKSGEAFLQSPETSSDQAECSSSVPHPGDWDPNYSDELLLQETSDMNTIISGVDSMHLGSLMAPAVPAIDPGFHHSRPNSFSILMNSRIDARGHEFLDADSSSASLHLGQSHPVSMSAYYPSNFPQNYSSRFRQPPASQFSHVQSALMRDERNYANGQFSRSNYSMLDTHSPASSGFGSAPSWGHQAGHPFVPVPPSSSHSKR